MQFHVKVYEDGSQWTADVVDAPGCVTCAKTREKALAAAEEALLGWLESYVSAGDVVPRPTKKVSTKGLAVIEVPTQLAVAVTLRWARADMGFTQAQLAKLTSVSQQQIAKLERPGANPSIATLAKLATGLGMRVEISLVV